MCALSLLLFLEQIINQTNSLECVQLYRKDDLFLAMTYYMEELFDVTEMFGALQLCE
jgi:hypothetical protein